MRKIFIYVFLSILIFSNNALASDVPLIEKSAPVSQKRNVIPIYNHYPPNNYYINNFYYSTTLTTKELRALSDIRKRSRLELKCKEHKAKKSKCEKLMEE